ncbi:MULTISPECIES: hypothetical protein [Tenebrionibacter/Tenebrionicola group]|nr:MULTISPECIES: hypothetical protein [Tenebrionibacter/Tenebrionicola group]
MMVKNKRALFGVVLLAGAISGCTLDNTPTRSYSAGNSSAASSQVQAQPVQPAQPTPTTAWSTAANGAPQTVEVMNSERSITSQRLQTCLAEARQLARIGKGSYNNLIGSLQRSIAATKYYAGIAGQLSGNTQDTITPLYQYKINDTCNTISQSLLSELKKGDL